MKALSTLTILLSLFSVAFSLTKELKNYEAFCITSTLPADDQFSGMYVVSGYQEKSVAFNIYSPQNQAIYTSENKREDAFSVNITEAGDYRTCFRNLGKEFTFITFEIRSSLTDAQTVAISQGHISTMDFQLREVLTSVLKLRSGLRAQEMRERIHAMTLDKLDSKAWWYTFVKVVIAMMVAGGQLYIYQGFFQKKVRAFV